MFGGQGTIKVLATRFAWDAKLSTLRNTTSSPSGAS